MCSARWTPSIACRGIGSSGTFSIGVKRRKRWRGGSCTARTTLVTYSLSEAPSRPMWKPVLLNTPRNRRQKVNKKSNGGLSRQFVNRRKVHLAGVRMIQLSCGMKTNLNRSRNSSSFSSNSSRTPWYSKNYLYSHRKKRRTGISLILSTLAMAAEEMQLHNNLSNNSFSTSIFQIAFMRQ